MMSLRRRVLIVDDHAPFRQIARLMLESGGFEVIGEAMEGDGALAAVAALHPDVVLLDVHLPGRDGFTIAAELTAESDPPLVVLASTEDPADADGLALAAGARGFLAKHEFSAPALTALLDRV